MRADLKLVLGELDRLSAKLTQLLQYSKPAVVPAEAEGSVLGAEAIAKVVTLLQRDAEQRGVAIEFAYPKEDANVRGSGQALSEIFSNLILNAVESQPNGGRVQIEAARRNGCMVIEVCDQGLGIPAGARGKILEPFFTTKASGTGLGLAIVKRRLSEIGGTLDCESPLKDGRGTKFTVTLPLTTS